MEVPTTGRLLPRSTQGTQRVLTRAVVLRGAAAGGQVPYKLAGAVPKFDRLASKFMDSVCRCNTIQCNAMQQSYPT